MTGRLAIKNGKYYVIISYKDEHGKNKQKWTATGLDAKNNKRAAEEVMREIVANFNNEETPTKIKQEKAKDKMLFGDYLIKWIEIAKPNLQLSTYASYKMKIKRIAPYFNERGITLQGITPTDIQTYYELLRVKNILGILDGDINFGQIETDSDKTIPISMPYLSGPTLCDISNRFGLAAEYGWNGGSLSRWAYLDNLIAHCIEKNTVSDLLAFLFSKEQFIQKLNGFTPEVIENAYTTIVSTIISQINGALYFGGNELIQVNKTYIIHPIDSPINVVVTTIKTIDRQYISDLSNRAMKDVNEGNFDSAITKSRTLLEETFCYVIEKKGDTPSDSGDIGKLYNQVKQLYNMHQDKNMDKRINGLLSGLEKILSAIAEMRNVGSDSHGVGAKRISIAEHHAKLFVNAAMIMADFILSVEENAVK